MLTYLRVVNRDTERDNRTKKQTSDVVFCISLESLNNALFDKEIAVGLSLASVERQHCHVSFDVFYMQSSRHYTQS